MSAANIHNTQRSLKELKILQTSCKIHKNITGQSIPHYRYVWQYPCCPVPSISRHLAVPPYPQVSVEAPPLPGDLHKVITILSTMSAFDVEDLGC